MSLLDHVWMVMTELGPWLIVGAVISGLLHGLLPSGFVRRHLQGRFAVLKAVVLGIPLPLCSCGVIPAGVGLKRDGASDGAAVGFLTATPQTGVDSILVSAGMLGLPFALMKVFAALVTGLVSGHLVDWTGGGAEADDAADVSCAVDTEQGRTIADMWAHGVDMVRMIWRWLVFGIVASAAIGVWLPPGALADLGMGSGAAAFAWVLVASVPLYVCATASVPIAAALVAGGLPTGAALVFLMAGPATNVATLGAVWRAFGGRVLAIYLGTLIAGSVAFGLAFEWIAGSLGFAALASADPHAAHQIAWWQTAGAVILAAALLWFAFEELRALVGRMGAVMHTTDQTITIGVKGMTCGGCSSRLERVLNRDEAIDSARVLLDEERAEISGGVSVDRVVELIEGAGFEAVRSS
ncbi:MAG: permease [Myxococcales bacterium]|nr:permease [Myxococcales bacterium]